MDIQMIAKQMLDMQRTAFDNTFSTITMLQDQGERILNTFLEQSPLLPNEGKVAFENWIQLCKKARDEYKKTITCRTAGSGISTGSYFCTKSNNYPDRFRAAAGNIQDRLLPEHNG